MENEPSTPPTGTALDAAERTDVDSTPPSASWLSRTATVLPRVVLEEGRPVVARAPRQRYVEGKPLGTGAIGEVVLARDYDIERHVAIKRLKAGRQDVASQLRFAEEIRTVGQLEHPNIVPVHDVGVDEQGNQFFVMRYIQGETLRTIIEGLREGVPEYVERFTHRYRIQLFIEVLRAIRHAHDAGVIHRDLKPSNIMVGRSGEVMVMDWGLAKRVRGGPPVPDLAAPPTGDAEAAYDSHDRGFASREGAMIGTPLYMSPEQARGDTSAIDERSDVYSLCAVLHELMTLRHYQGRRESVAHVLHGLLHEPSLTQGQAARNFVDTGAPLTVAYYVRRGLSKDPAKRFQSVAEMLRRLENIRDNRIPVECHVTLVQRAGQEALRTLDKHPIVLLVGMLVAVGFLVAKAVHLAMWLMHR
jgi:serine/threonine-protein kinase